MLSAVFAGVVRYRRTVLSGAVVVTCAVVALALLLHGVGRVLLNLVSALLVVPLAVLGLVAYFRPRQAAFAVDPRTPAFRTLSHEAQVFATLTIVSLSAEGILGRLSFNHGLAGGGPIAVVLRVQGAALWVLAVVVVALAAANLALAWRGVGVQLRPDGLVDKGLGSLVVPWQALAPGYPLPPPPTATKLALTFAHPQLVRRKGLVFWSSVQAGNVDPVFLASAIRFYVANPDRRPLIGTQAGYDELLQVASGPPASTSVSPERGPG